MTKAQLELSILLLQVNQQNFSENIAKACNLIKENHFSALNFDGQEFTELQCAAMAKIIADSPSLQVFGLHNCHIHANGLSFIFKAMATHAGITNLHLDRIAVIPHREVVETLHPMCRHDAGTHLLGDAEMQLIATMLESNTALKQMSLTANDIGDQGIQHLTVALQKNSDSSLWSVDLFNNNSASKVTKHTFKDVLAVNKERLMRIAAQQRGFQ